MASAKISALTALGAAPASGDLLAVVDISDPTDAASGTTKKMTVANLLGAGIGGSTGATDNAVLRADGTGGATVQNSNLTIPDDAAATEVGYLNIPQNSQSAAYTA